LQGQPGFKSLKNFILWEKALGAVLLLAGVFLILRPDRG
jgi:hypothetical protein